MFNINGCEDIANSLSTRITLANWGTGTTTKDYTDTSLETQILEKSVDSTELKGNGELLVIANIDYSEANGNTISETGLKGSAGQYTISSHYGLEKNSGEKYNYFYDIYVVPKEALL